MEQVLNVAIITARGGSKRIPFKNIKNFLGKPILAYSISAALESGLFEEVMVSTDNEEIAGVAKKYGAVVPFLRSENASDDFASTEDALLEVFESYAAAGRRFEYGCCLYPTAPFVNANKLITAYQKLLSENVDTVFPVMPFSYPILRSLKMDNDRLKMNWEEYRESRSQDLPAAYHDAGQFYFFKVNTFLQKKSLFTNNTSGLVINELEGQDIDNLTDWRIAELKFQLLQNNHA